MTCNNAAETRPLIKVTEVIHDKLLLNLMCVCPCIVAYA